MDSRYMTSPATRSVKTSRLSNQHIINKEKAAWTKVKENDYQDDNKQDEVCTKTFKTVLRRKPNKNYSDGSNIRPSSAPILLPNKKQISSVSQKVSKKVQVIDNNYKTAGNEKQRSWQIKTTVDKDLFDDGLDFDFAEKIKAFRSLIKTNASSEHLRNETIRPKSGCDDARIQGDHVRFSSKSMEGRSSAPNEFQLTYQQDRQKYLNMIMHEDSSSNRIGQRKHNKHYDEFDSITSIEKEALLSEKVRNAQTHGDKYSSSESQVKPATIRIIKRPSEYVADKVQLDNAISSLISKQKYAKEQIATHHQIETYEPDSFRHDNRSNQSKSSFTKVNNETDSNTNPSHFYDTRHQRRPNSVIESDQNDEFQSFTNDDRIRSHSTNLCSKQNAASPLSLKQTREGSLRTQLNVLGASLSSLSSILDSAGERSETIVDKDTRQRSRHRSSISRLEANLSPQQRINKHRRKKDEHSVEPINDIESKSADLQQRKLYERNTPVVSLTEEVGISKQRHNLRLPRSDDYLVMCHDDSLNSPRIKQTNVRCFGEELMTYSSLNQAKRSYSASLISNPLDEEWHTSSKSHYDQHVVKSNILESQHYQKEKKREVDLKHYVRYLSRHKDILDDDVMISKDKRSQITKQHNGHDHRLPMTEQRANESMGYGDKSTLNQQKLNGSFKEYQSKSKENKEHVAKTQSIIARKANRNVIESSEPRNNKPEDIKMSPRVTPNNNTAGQKNSSHSSRDPKSSSKGDRTTSNVVEVKRVIKRPCRENNPNPNERGLSKSIQKVENKSKPQLSSQSTSCLTSPRESGRASEVAILPSRYKVIGASNHQRPHSAIEGKTHTKEKYASDLITNPAKDSKTVKLLSKIKNLHKEVDERLKSDLNKKHSLTSSISDLLENVNSGSDDEELEMIAKQNEKYKQIRQPIEMSLVNQKGKIVIKRKGKNNEIVCEQRAGDLDLLQKHFSKFENMVSTSTPRKDTVSSQIMKSYSNDEDNLDGSTIKPCWNIKNSYENKTSVQQTRRSMVDSSDSENEDTNLHASSAHNVKGKTYDRRGNVMYDSNSITDFQSLLTKGHHYRNRILSDVSLKERDRERFDDDKDEDDTMTNDKPLYRNNTVFRSSSVPVGTRDNGRHHKNTPFVTHRTSMDSTAADIHRISMYDAKRQTPDFQQRTNSGRKSPADLLVGYLDDPNTVRLLQKLYNADPTYRQIIMIKVLYFKAWVHFSKTYRQKRLKKQALMQSADIFCYQRVLALHFIVWARRARYSKNYRLASELCRQHMLTKGFKALRWSVSHSRHCRELVQTKYRMLTTRASFDKWRKRTVSQRQSRLENTWHVWKQYVTEVNKIRNMQEVMNRNIMEQVYFRWKTRYDKHRKQRMAFFYLRRTLYQHTFISWSKFVVQRKHKKDKSWAAVYQYQTNLTKTTFFQFMLMYKKIKRAKAHFRNRKLNEVFWLWQEASQVCRTERCQDVATSVAHYKKHLITYWMTQWKQRLLLSRAETHANKHIYRRTFQQWVVSYQHEFTKRHEMELAIEKNKLHQALVTWRRNVVRIQRRHQKAVELVERCFLRKAIKTWRTYVGARLNTRRKVFVHRVLNKKRMLHVWFGIWRNRYDERMKERHKKEQWSESCTKKLSRRWRYICQLRSLEKRLIKSEPDRKLHFLRTMFTRWTRSMEKRRQEEEMAENMRKALEQKNLFQHLQLWRTETQKYLTIKPLIKRQNERHIEMCFQAWQHYTKSVVNCRKSKSNVLNTQTKRWFIIWRHQFAAHKVEQTIRQRISEGLLACSFIEWRLLIQLKKKSKEFLYTRLVIKSFNAWRMAASNQISVKIKKKEEATNKLMLQRNAFVSWCETTQNEKVEREKNINQVGATIGRNIICKAFVQWKRLLYSTLVSCSYQKMQNQRLVLTLFLEWQHQSQHDVNSSVNIFREKIGLCSRESIDNINELRDDSITQRSEFAYFEEDETKMTISGSLLSSVNANVYTRLHDDNETSSMDGDADRISLLCGGLQHAAISHQARRDRMRQIATSFIWRLRHWPIGVVFQQWQDFTARMIGIKQAATKLRVSIDVLETTLFFRKWRIEYLKMKKSREKWDYQILSTTFVQLRQYTTQSRRLKEMKTYSHKHLRLKVYRIYFPVWLRKTQKQKHEKHAVNLWSSRTAEELELLPLEYQFSSKLSSRTLRLCFSLWLLKVTHIQKIRHVYHTNTLKWIFKAWQDWASYRHSLDKRCVTMVTDRRTKLAFNRWKVKYHQSKQTEALHKQAWFYYQVQILIEWRQWTKAACQRRKIYNSFKTHHSVKRLATYFKTWRLLTCKVGQLKSQLDSRRLSKVFQGWQDLVQETRTKKQMTDQFQIRSYTLQVKRQFHQWHRRMLHHRTLKEQQQIEAEGKALEFGRIWKKKCQTLRGIRLQNALQLRQMLHCLQTWQSRFVSIQVLYDQLDVWQKNKNGELMKRCLQTWFLNLKTKAITRDFKSKLLYTVMDEWRRFTNESRERRKRGVALTRALQERNIHVYFQFWVALTKMKVTVRANAETKLQIKILRSWHSYAKNTYYLRQLEIHFRQQINRRIVSNAFTKMCWRAEYCSHLQGVADKIVNDRKKATLRAVIILWRQRRDNILAARCYGGILVVRVIRQWHRFVHKQRMEREREMCNRLMSIDFDRRITCKKAFAGFKEMISVSKMVEKRRQRLCNKFAMKWKHNVDMRMSAVEMEWDNVCWSTWRMWRRQFVQRQTAKKIESDNNRNTVALVFKSWRRLCKPCKESAFYQSLSQKQDRRIPLASQLPVPKRRGQSNSTFSH